MSLGLGTVAPNFTQDSSEGKINFHEWIGNNWVVFFSHPADYTPVCTTELGVVARLKPQFDKRNTKVLALSVDSAESHRGWIKDIEETQDVKINYPIIADADKSVSNLYAMIHPATDPKVTVRSVFFIDPNKKIRATLTYPPPTGRNFDEILRILDALQLTDQYQVATPANWTDGKDCIVLPSISDEDAKKKFPKGFRKLKDYLRITPQPNK